ncbi:MAG: multidrug efflux pump, partial [Rhodospirillaceae bacterium]|nr:multidrug efflux pump [Rhodospirillaceae bacterium]
VVSILILTAGLVAMPLLPISEYPEIVPPTVVISGTYPGASPKTIAETVITPLEQQINGVENAIYTNSSATPDGNFAITVTFKLGTNLDTAQVQTQNRVSQAEPRLPDVVRQIGLITQKRSPDLTMVVFLRSEDGRYDSLYLRNYAVIQVRDVLARLPGMGDVRVFGSGDYAMRLWLDPAKIASRDMTVDDVLNAVREQNVQVAAGQIGGQPALPNTDFEYIVNAMGRLQTEAEFGNIIIKSGAVGEVVYLRDVARVELGPETYALRSMLDGKPAVGIPVFQLPGANALDLSASVRKAMVELAKSFPEGVSYTIAYDPTVFVRSSIEAVIHTLIEAVLLVVLVVVVFLQTWRASVVPLVAVPIAIVGAMAVLLLLGFSINSLSLFGLVLATGIVVDDAIVVVENVERKIEDGLPPREAAHAAMAEVTRPIISIMLVLCSVFVPVAFLSGITGQFYRQFALTIAISTVISAINSLTLSPALAAMLLKSHDAPKDILTRLMDRLFGWFFRRFNRAFRVSSDAYSNGVGRVISRKAVMMGIYLVLVGVTFFMFRAVPGGFVPSQDKQYLVGFAQLPDGATLDRTEDVIRRMSDIALKTPGIESAVAFPGLSINGFTNSSNAGIVFVTLKPFEERKTPDLSGFAIAGDLNKKFAGIKEAFIAMFPPPPVQGIGTIGGFKLQIEDRVGRGYEALDDATKAFLAKARATPELAGIFSGYQVNVPQLYADIDRTKARQLGVAVTDVFETMQIYLGSLYVNDFNKFGRTYSVLVQADAKYRARADDVGQLKVRSASGAMIPLSALLKVRQSAGPERAMRYNGFLAADINGGAAPGFSSGQAQAAIARVAAETLPNGFDFEWTDLTYQEILAGNSAVLLFPLAILLVFLVLAAMFGVWMSNGDNNVFTQIGLIVLVGLSAKNAILIVEFARELEFAGRTPVQAALESTRLRLRPILMTSLAFVMGVLPLVLSTGAGSEMRHAMGVAVFAGMIGVTAFGLFLTPVFYVLLRSLAGGRQLKHHGD